MVEIIARYHNSLETEPRIILLTPPPVSEPLISQYLAGHSSVRFHETTFAYSRALLNLTVPTFVEKLDFHESIQLAPAQSYLRDPKLLSGDNLRPFRFENGGMFMGYEEYLSDGVHLKDPSYKILYILVMECINRRWPEILPERMIMPVHWWGDIINNPQTLRDEL